jgi:hypothetical protein
MKKIHLLLVLAFQLIAFESNAQVSVNLVVNTTPPATLATWAYKKQTIVYLVTGSPAFVTQYKIKTEIQLTDGTVIGKTDLTRSKTYTLTSGNTVYNAEDVMPLENMIFSGSYKNTLEKSGKLPSETYQICVQLVTDTEYAPISNSICKVFNLIAPQLPVLMKPYNEQVLDAEQSKTAITFRWTPVLPKPQGVPTYKILVFEVLQDQTPMQAVRSNMPILNQDVVGATQYIWMPQGILNQNPSDENGIVKPKKLVWTIQSFESQEQVFSDGSMNGDAVSEPAWFTIAAAKK